VSAWIVTACRETGIRVLTDLDPQAPVQGGERSEKSTNTAGEKTEDQDALE
jgi:hypothetical protein